MPKVSPIQSNFNGGEISPLLYGRVDVPRYKESLAICKNYVPLIQGPIIRRSGSGFVFPVKDSSAKTVLIPFEFSTTQAYMLEFGNQYIRVYKNNAILTSATNSITGITKANPAVATYSGSDNYSNGDRVVITGVVGMTEVNNREFTVANVNTGANTFQLSGINSSAYTTYASGGSVSKIYEISSPYVTADLSSIQFTQSDDVLYLVHGSYASRKLIRTTETNWSLNTISFLDGPYGAIDTIDNGNYLPSNLVGIATSTNRYGGVWVSANTGTGIYVAANPYQIKGSSGNINNNGSGLIRLTIDTKLSNLETGTICYFSMTAENGGQGYYTITKIDDQNFDLQGSTYSTIATPTGAAYLFPQLFKSTDVGRIIRIKGSTKWGWAKITSFHQAVAGHSFNSGGLPNNGPYVLVDIQSDWDVPTSGGGANYITDAVCSDWRLGLWSDTNGWPITTTFHQDRLVFAGAGIDPTRFDGSNTSDYENFAPSALDGAIGADNAYSFNLASNDVNSIKWMSSDEQGLLMGTSGGEWLVGSADSSSALSALSVSAKKATSYGSDSTRAVQSGKSSIFIQRGGRKLRELNYYFDVNGFRAADLTQMSEHITSSQIIQLAVQKLPQPTVWAVRNDGVLIAMTYERDLDALKVGWARHVLGGDNAEVESVAVIPSADGESEDVWVTVKRTVNSQTVRYIEYLTQLFETDSTLDDAFFVDSGLIYNGSSTNTISSLNHLEGQTVSVLANGSPQSDKVVSSGRITLDSAATYVVVGLSYNSDAQFLRRDAGSADGTAMGKTRRTHRIGLMLLNTMGLKAGSDFDSLDDISLSDIDDINYDQALGMYSGIWSGNITTDYDFDNTICIRQSQPLPGTIQGFYPQMVEQDR